MSVWYEDESTQICFWDIGWKILGFIHENGIEIDPKRIEATKKVEAPTCKKDLQKFLAR